MCENNPGDDDLRTRISKTIKQDLCVPDHAENVTYRGKSNSPSNLGHSAAGAAKRRACHVVAAVVVHDDRDDKIGNDHEYLLDYERLREVPGVTQLRDEAHPGQVAGDREHDVRDAVEGGGERGVQRGRHGGVRGLGRYSEGDNGD